MPEPNYPVADVLATCRTSSHRIAKNEHVRACGIGACGDHQTIPCVQYTAVISGYGFTRVDTPSPVEGSLEQLLPLLPQREVSLTHEISQRIVDGQHLTHSNMTLSVMQGVRLCVSVVSGIELAGLFHAYQANLTRFPAAAIHPMASTPWCDPPSCAQLGASVGHHDGDRQLLHEMHRPRRWQDRARQRREHRLVPV